MKYLLFIILFYSSFNSYCQQVFALTNVNVIPMNKETVLKNQTVVIENGRIKSIISSANYRVPPEIFSIDCTDKYLMPGLIDMHAHFFYEQGIPASEIPKDAGLMLANGLTTTRIMNGHPAYLQTKKDIANSKIPGPELFVVSPQLVGEWPFTGPFIGKIVTTPVEASSAIPIFKREGYDEIKLTFFLKPDVYDAIITTARAAGIGVTGHVGYAVRLPKALAARQQIEHFDEFLEMLLPDSILKAGVGISGPAIWKKQSWLALDKIDETKIPSLVNSVKASGIYLTPTNYFLHSSFAQMQSSAEVFNGPGFKFIPDSLKKERFDIKNRYWQSGPRPEYREKFIDIRRRLTKELHKAGVPLMAGSDSPEWFLVPGFSLHNELEEFVDCGLSEFEALETATTIPSRYLKINSRTGTIEKGKEADLILLNANPLEDIRNTRSILGVISNGKLYDTEALGELLK